MFALHKIRKTKRIIKIFVERTSRSIENRIGACAATSQMNRETFQFKIFAKCQFFYYNFFGTNKKKTDYFINKIFTLENLEKKRVWCAEIKMR